MAISSDRMDDYLWREVWERNLDHVERHNVAMSVWRRRAPDDPFESLVGWELAHRWRQRARNLAVVYLLWTAFWGLMAYAGLRSPESVALPLSLCLSVLGVAGIALCFAVRRRMRPIIDGRAGFCAAVAPTLAPKVE